MIEYWKYKRQVLQRPRKDLHKNRKEIKKERLEEIKHRRSNKEVR
jgi:hypothetical protein